MGDTKGTKDFTQLYSAPKNKDLILPASEMPDLIGKK